MAPKIFTSLLSVVLFTNKSKGKMRYWFILSHIILRFKRMKRRLTRMLSREFNVTDADFQVPQYLTLIHRLAQGLKSWWIMPYVEIKSVFDLFPLKMWLMWSWNLVSERQIALWARELFLKLRTYRIFIIVIVIIWCRYFKVVWQNCKNKNSKLDIKFIFFN